MAKKYMIGNWKMNQSLQEIEAFFTEFNQENLSGNFFVAPQALHLSTCLDKTNSIKIASQNISEHLKGAYTGELSPLALKELGITTTLIGHSERRSYYGETDTTVNAKVLTAIENNILPVICVGETLEERESGKTFDIVLTQVKNALSSVQASSSDDFIIAYEPVWAIGTGKTATSEQAQEVHGKIRSLLTEMYGDTGSNISILYGGSVKPANIQELLSQKDIDGGLVGGASLKAEDFLQLCRATL